MLISNDHAKSKRRESRCRRTSRDSSVRARRDLRHPTTRLPPHGSAAVDPGSGRCAGPALPLGIIRRWRLQKHTTPSRRPPRTRRSQNRPPIWGSCHPRNLAARLDLAPLLPLTVSHLCWSASAKSSVTGNVGNPPMKLGHVMPRFHRRTTSDRRLHLAE